MIHKIYGLKYLFCKALRLVLYSSIFLFEFASFVILTRPVVLKIILHMPIKSNIWEANQEIRILQTAKKTIKHHWECLIIKIKYTNLWNVSKLRFKLHVESICRNTNQKPNTSARFDDICQRKLLIKEKPVTWVFCSHTLHNYINQNHERTLHRFNTRQSLFVQSHWILLYGDHSNLIGHSCTGITPISLDTLVPRSLQTHWTLLHGDHSKLIEHSSMTITPNSLDTLVRRPLQTHWTLLYGDHSSLTGHSCTAITPNSLDTLLWRSLQTPKKSPKFKTTLITF